MSIGKRIRDARKAAGLTQGELAAKVHLSRSHIGAIELDRYNPSISTLSAIANAVDRPIERLVAPDNSINSIGTKLRECRIAANLTQRQVADFVGVTEATVSRWESGGIGNMRRDKIAKIAQILGISPLVIMGVMNDGAKAAEVIHSDNSIDLYKEESQGYYHDPETARIAQEMLEHPDRKVLFDASRGLKPESIEEVRKFIEYQRLKEEGRL